MAFPFWSEKGGWAPFFPHDIRLQRVVLTLQGCLPPSKEEENRRLDEVQHSPILHKPRIKCIQITDRPDQPFLTFFVGCTVTGGTTLSSKKTVPLYYPQYLGLKRTRACPGPPLRVRPDSESDRRAPFRLRHIPPVRQPAQGNDAGNQARAQNCCRPTVT